MQKNKLPNLITILVLTLITVLLWIGFSVYRAFSLAPEPSVPKNVSEPLVPTLDTSALKNVESALFFSQSQIPEVTFSSTGTPSATLIPTPTPLATTIASPSGTPVETASPSGTPTVP